jgi:UDP-N-acetylglucosamine 2-epimerase
MNIPTGAEENKIIGAVNKFWYQKFKSYSNFYGDKKASKKIVKILLAETRRYILGLS